jgi:hypothetical protein
MLHSQPRQAAREQLPPEHGARSANAVLLVLVVGTFLAPLDSSIVNIGLPSISAEFGIQPALVSWVATAYLLTSASLLLAMGRFGDVWGLRRLYVWGLLIFGAGSLACAMSGSIGMLIGSRVLQAVGASMLFAAGPALVTRTFPPERRGWALGYPRPRYCAPRREVTSARDRRLLLRPETLGCPSASRLRRQSLPRISPVPSRRAPAPCRSPRRRASLQASPQPTA